MSLKNYIKTNYYTRGLVYIPFTYFFRKKRKSELHIIGLKNGTDKADIYHTHKNLSYLDIYEKYFEEFRFKKINILEIGVRGGHSLRTWKNFFPKATIYGLDFNETCMEHVEDRVHIFIGDQANSEVLKKIVDSAGSFDIIIDDGSHINDLTLFSFNYLKEYLKNSGIYVMEDLKTSYYNLFESEDDWNGELSKNKNNDINLNNDRQKMNQLFLQTIKDIDHNNSDFSALHFWSKLAIFVK